MSDKLPNNQAEEEVDLGQLFNAIGGVFNRFIRFIGSIFRAILSSVVYVLKALIDNVKLITIVVIASAIIGYGLEKIKPEVYKSSMFVKPYFDSKYELVNNINYFNALISNQDYETLTTVFDITEEDAKGIKVFEIDIGPESENDKILQYDTYLKSLDSIRAQEISYDDFIENRDIFSSDFYKISVEAQKKNIFKSLELGLNASFENTYSEKKKKKRDSLIIIQKLSIQASIRSVDSLQKVYIDVLKEDSRSNNNTISLTEGFSIEPENSKTKEFELLNKELSLRKELRVLEEQKIQEDDFFDIVSGFQEIGSISSSFFDLYTVILPFLSFLILCFVFVTRRTIKFVKTYDA
jgi:hypothetical protein